CAHPASYSSSRVYAPMLRQSFRYCCASFPPLSIDCLHLLCRQGCVCSIVDLVRSYANYFSIYRPPYIFSSYETPFSCKKSANFLCLSFVRFISNITFSSGLGSGFSISQ